MEKTLYELVKNCTVRIQVEGGNGTGFFVAPGLVLTCAHVIHPARAERNAIKIFYKGDVLPVESIVPEEVFPEKYPDLALLRVYFQDHPCVLLGTDVNVFDDLYSYGYTHDHPEGESITVECEGVVGDDQELLKLKEGQVKPGSSGSPLLNRRTGRVCGMMKLTRDRATDLGGAAIPLYVIFSKYPTLEDANLAYHQSNSNWRSLLEKEQEAKASKSIVALLYTESGKIARPKYFVGREQMIKQVSSLLDQSCQVLLTGMAGIGKTSLAQVLVDEQLKKGMGKAVWVEIRYEKVETIIESLADRLGDDQISKIGSIEEKLSLLKALLKKSELSLLVLENVNNVEAADKILSIVPETVAVLVTSRQRFAVDEIIEVDMLSSTDALNMLEKTSGFKDLSNNADAVFLCEQLGYHPYALELAGSMMRELNRTPKELRRRLAGAPLDLSSSTRGRLRALLDDSAANLNANARGVLFAFGAFPSNGATSALLAAYLDSSIEEISNSLDELIKRNLIKRRPETEFYFLHDLTYYYVRSQAKPENEEDVQNLVDGVVRYLTDHRYDYDVLSLDLPNLLNIAGSTQGLNLVKIVSFLAIGNYPLQEGKSYADQRGYSIGLIEQLDRTIETSKGIGDELKTTTHYLLGKRGNAAFWRGDYGIAVEKYREEFMLSPDEERQVKIGSILARTLAFHGNVEEARQYFGTARELAEKMQNDELRIYVLEEEGWAAVASKDYPTLLRAAEKQLTVAEGLYVKDPKTYEYLAFALLNYGTAKLELAKEGQGDINGILDLLNRAKSLAEKHEDDVLLAQAFTSLGEYYQYVGDRDQAKLNFSHALRLRESLEMTQYVQELKKLLQELESLEASQEEHHERKM